MKKLIALLAVLAVFGLATAQAGYVGTFTGLVNGDDYEVYYADQYFSGGSAGNTVSQSGGGYYDGSTWPTDPPANEYRVEAFSSFAGGCAHTPKGSGTPGVVTTVSGLASGQYDVYVVLLTPNHYGDAASQWDAGLTSAMGVTCNDSTYTDRLQGSGGDLVWTYTTQYVGTTATGATGFSLYVDPDGVGYGIGGYYGAAYQEVPVPEPAGLGLMGVALLALRKRRS